MMESCHAAMKVSGLFIVLMLIFIVITGILLWWVAGHENLDK
jgi:CHASE3 domain sensor protein